MSSTQKTNTDAQDRILEVDLYSELKHGVAVSNLAYDVAEEMGLNRDMCYQMAIAGILHDIGKLKLVGYINGQENNPLVIEELKYVRMHSTLSYEILKDQGYSGTVLESILYHHENYDGSGYPSNKSGTDIPLGARILRVCDVFAALTTDRSYRGAFEEETVMRMMIEEIKNFDMQVFLAFQRVVHKKKSLQESAGKE
nr:HD domain-containing phosphohydrolase [uncultured Blautia sp.]